MAKKTPSLSIGRGEKLPASKGAGLTAKGRAKYNAATGSNLKAPQPEGGARKKSFFTVFYLLRVTLLRRHSM